MAQSVKPVTLGLGSGHDIVVHEIEPRVRLCAGSKELAWDSFSSLSAPPLLELSLSVPTFSKRNI